MHSCAKLLTIRRPIGLQHKRPVSSDSRLKTIRWPSGSGRIGMFKGFNVALRRLAVAAFALAAVGAGAPALAKDFPITVWSGGTSDPEHYRVDNIKLAAEQLQREARAEGKDLKIKVDARVDLDLE